VTYAEALAYLARIEGLGIRLALENIGQVLDALGNPQRRFPSVLVSGTNGKGSVAAMLASILDRAGRRTGLYTSPHLVRHEERIVVSGRPIGPRAFADVVGRVREAAEALLARGALKAHPTHFETITAAAFLHLAEAGVDAAVLEVGMGGRLDATVLARPRLSLVTNVALEHTAYLGSTIGAIAAEKAGVLVEGGTLLTGETHPEAAAAFEARAAQVGGRLVPLASYARAAVEEGRLTVRTARREHRGLEVGLGGPHQAANATLAVAACDLLEEMGIAVPEEAVRRGIAEVVWPGRMQLLPGSPRILLDGAHNPAACRALREALGALPGVAPGRTVLLFGVLRDKDHLGMMAELLPAAGTAVLVRGSSPRFREPGLLAEAARGLLPAAPRLIVAGDVAEGLGEARAAAPPDGLVCVAGSLYLVGEVMQLLGVEPWPAPA
jgi:dihydrofolate synthase/folylpolyglutamate synthase